MSTHSRLFLFLLVLGFTACSTDVDLYADYEDVPVVYALLNAKADTNYIKITKSFCSDNDHPIDAFSIAPIADSSNFPGKLDASIIELQLVNGQGFQPTGRVIYLDTITIHNKQEGVFYAPHQKLYFTTERFNTNQGNRKYRYRLQIVKPDYDTVTAETSIVNGDLHLYNTSLSFQSAPTSAFHSLIFASIDEAVVYEISMEFNYWEQHHGEPLVKKQVAWTFGARTLYGFEKVEGTENLYRLYYPINGLFNHLEQAIGNDTVWDVNNPNVVRYMDDFIIHLSAAGEDYYNSYQALQSTQNGISLSSGYTNINGGFGIFSSRIHLRNKATLSSTTKYDLFRKPWGFVER